MNLGPRKTGWPPDLLQDDSRELFRWFADRLDARYQLRLLCAEIVAKRQREKKI